MSQQVCKIPSPTLASLPSEVVHRIAELLDATHARSLVALAQASRGLYAIVSAFLFRTIKITITNGDYLAREVQHWERVLLRDDGLKHVRQLILHWAASDDSWQPEHNSYLSLAQCELSEDDTNLQSCWDLYLPWWGSHTEAAINDEEWKPVERLLRQLPGLTDLFYSCPGRFPPFLLQILHEAFVQDATPRCRLHHFTFRLSASDEASLQVDERALVTSPCLFSIGDLNCEKRNSFESRTLARRNAPFLQRIFAYWDQETTDSHEHQDTSNSLDPPSLEHLRLFKSWMYAASSRSPTGLHHPLPPSVIDMEVSGDFSALRVLQINVPMMEQMLPAPSKFPSLVTFSVVCPKVPFTSAWSSPFLAFLRHLPCVTTLRVLGWDRSTSITPGLSPKLQKLELGTCIIRGGPPLLDEHVLQLDELCPDLEDLTIEIKRSRGDAAEVARYRALGRLPRLRRLTLSLDAAPPGIIYDTEADSSARQGQRRPYNPPGHTVIEPWFEAGWDAELAKAGLGPHRNGHVRDALVNSAIDSALALSIVGFINTAKVIDSR